jgi:hypothetical protein
VRLRCPFASVAASGSLNLGFSSPAGGHCHSTVAGNLVSVGASGLWTFHEVYLTDFGLTLKKLPTILSLPELISDENFR